MEFLKFGDRYVLRLEPGEELQATLRDFVERQEIRGGYFIAFGAFERVRLQYFDVARKQYRDNPVDRQVEVVSLMGNIGRAEGEPVLHIHGAFGDGEARTYSGHVAEGVVRPTLEVFLTDLGGELRREKDPATGLQLLSLEGEASEELEATAGATPTAASYTP
jgi:predicted DNA-binding protein with PD1-like motif